MAEQAPPSKIATFGVRFETQDHFLVEYTDHLRRGVLMLPGALSLTAGAPVRIKLHLPNRAILYLTGAVSESAGEGEVTATPVRLAPFSAEQERILGLCVDAVIDDGQGAAPPTPARPLEVLLVEDSDSIRAEIYEALTRRGLKVRVAENGLVAVSAALKEEPDVILTDVEMPVMDGWTLLRMARSRKKLANLPIVFFTSLSDELSRLQGYRMGVDDYLAKRTPPDEIIARLQGVVSRRAQQSALGPEASGLRGDLQHVGLASVLSFLEAEKKTGDLNLERDGERASLRLFQGVLRDVRPLTRGRAAIDRVFEILGWRAGSFEFSALPITADIDHGALPPTSVTYLLIEHARREDEASERSL
ncbi:MAG: response regulator [Nannocystis sp.]|nr:response regulator [Nannocystis sp.]